MDSPELSLGSMFGVKGLVVVITGGGTGLGRALTSAFAQNGVKVIIVGRRMDVLQKAANELKGEIVPVQGDISSKAGIEQIVKDIRRHTDVVNTLVNCAGIAITFRDPGRPDPRQQYEDPDVIQEVLGQVTDEDWTRTNAVNVNAPFFLSTQLVPLLRKSSNPNIVNFSSVAGLANQRANNHFTYGVSKAATVHMPSMLAGRLHPFVLSGAQQ